jgi:hypothetical protein
MTVAAVSAFGWPTLGEVEKVKPMVAELMSSKEALEPDEAADAALEFAAEAKTEAARFLLLRRGVELYAKAGDDEKASRAFVKMLRDIKNVPPAMQETVVLGAGRALAKTSRPVRMEAIYKGVRALVWAEKELNAARTDLRKTKKDAPEAHLRAGNALAVMGDWPKALDHLLGAKGKIAPVAEHELNGTATLDRLANAWWKAAALSNGKYVKSAYRLHSAELYRKAIDGNLLDGLTKSLAEGRVAEVEKDNENDAVAQLYALQKQRNEKPLYCVIDLSDGPDADKYPVTYMDEPPKGGFNTDEYKTTKLVLKRLEAGTFKMQGSTNVKLTKPFFCGLFEVTQRQYELVTGANPCSSASYGKGNTYPVYYVSYNMIRGSSNGAKWPSSSAVDSSSFMGKLRARTGLDFDLPTEAQWEYACRAGTTTTYSYGDSANGNYMWYSVNSSNKTHPVGTKSASLWGFYDMHGNVWEWCLDWHSGTLAYGTDPKGSSSGSRRVRRGGSWYSDASCCTSSYRIFDLPSNESCSGGFRLVRTLSE